MPYQLGASSSYQFPKAPNLTHQMEGDDPFIRLNDDLIVSHILTRLPLEDAVRSSVLCHRWKKLWTESIGPRLIFSYSSDRLYNPEYAQEQDVLRFKPLLEHGICHILETYLQPKLEELTICFDFDSTSSHLIDSWIEYAIKKGVTRLVLDFSRWKNHFPKKNYTFPGVDKFLAWCAMRDDNLYQPVNHGSLSNLRDICLKYINVSKEVIECLLSHCPLERLGVWKSMLSQQIRVCERANKLKTLEFVNCAYTKIIISLPHLVKLKYNGYMNGLCLLHVPLLSELSIGSGCFSFLRNNSPNFGYIYQTKRLTLDLSYKLVSTSTGLPLEFPELSKLEQLEVRLQAWCESCLLWPIILIKAAPNLHRFLVKLHTQINQRPFKTPQLVELERNWQTATKEVHHQHLKSIKMYGFAGHANEVELGKHLFGISQSLEQFVVRPLLPGNRGKPHPQDDISSSVKTHRELAQQFKAWLPPTAKLVVL